MEKIEMLKELATKGGNFTADERAFVKAEAEALGLSVKKTNCRQCWSDLAVEVVARLKAAQSPETAPAAGRWSVVPGLDVVCRGRRINTETITDELAEWLLSIGFPKKYLVENASQDNSVNEI